MVLSLYYGDRKISKHLKRKLAGALVLKIESRKKTYEVCFGLSSLLHNNSLGSDNLHAQINGKLNLAFREFQKTQNISTKFLFKRKKKSNTS